MPATSSIPTISFEVQNPSAPTGNLVMMSTSINRLPSELLVPIFDSGDPPARSFHITHHACLSALEAGCARRTTSLDITADHTQLSSLTRSTRRDEGMASEEQGSATRSTCLVACEFWFFSVLHIWCCCCCLISISQLGILQ